MDFVRHLLLERRGLGVLHFDYVAETAGTFKLDVRAVTEDGTVSPLASSVVFDVEA